MNSYIWLALTLVFLALTLYYSTNLFMDPRKRYSWIWDLISAILSGFITIFSFFIYSNFHNDVLGVTETLPLYLYLFSAVFVLSIIRLSNSIIKDLEKKHKEFEKINKELIETTELQKLELKEKRMIEKLLKSKEEFINQLSHDLRTPLVPLKNLLPLIKKKCDKEKEKDMINICLRNTNYLEKLVQDTLELAKMNSPTLILFKKEFNIRELINEIKEINKNSFKKENLSIKNEVDNISIYADKIKIRELFENLINNSMNYNDKMQKKINISSSVEKDKIILYVKDNGVGLEKDDLKKVFDEFYKVDSSRHTHNSTGLGLSIVKKIVDKHKGSIHAKSEGLNKGTTMIIRLPITKK
ncbi:hypothetical protein C0585_03570 [Candidatus Woesearchaeota archaeon]|nr:MAG: hypothetical protein C0585_03570 [Candidatus Woesearchaeota archaeon]